ncbi:hypothetical protein DID77_03615 [Candidatus Marinamargulisbacteria bacterium SCGC AG-439-L15]|nr:hypothetical protein DID77_03615 [Candidatus Marinamargulisbacteria bacterium SCGC AG-439-L15]
MGNTVSIYQYQLGPMDNFLYILVDDATKLAAVVDPAWDVSFLCKELDRLGCVLDKVLLTHGHHDHINGLNDLLSTHAVPVYLSKYESGALTPEVPSLIGCDDNDDIPLGDSLIKVMHTPGHSPGCQCFLVGNDLISGDTLFINGCGRADLGGSDPHALYQSLERLKKLPDDTTVYPGHDYGDRPVDTIGEQKTTNPYLLAETEKVFLRKRMGFS